MSETFEIAWEMVKMASLGNNSDIFDEPADTYTFSFTDENGNEVEKKFSSRNDLQRLVTENRLEKVGDREFKVEGYRNGKLTYRSYVQ